MRTLHLATLEPVWSLAHGALARVAGGLVGLAITPLSFNIGKCITTPLGVGSVTPFVVATLMTLASSTIRRGGPVVTVVLPTGHFVHFRLQRLVFVGDGHVSASLPAEVTWVGQ